MERQGPRRNAALGRFVVGGRTRRELRGRRDRLAAEAELAVLEVDHDPAVVAPRAGEQLAAEYRLELALQQALQRAGAVDRIVAGGGEVLERPRRQLELDLPLGQPRAQPAELDHDDLLQLLAAERVEDDDLVD